MWINGISYSLTEREGVKLLSGIWSSASSTRNVWTPSYSKPPSSWREIRLSSRLTLFCQIFWAAGSCCSGGQRCWSIQIIHTRTIYQTQALWILEIWGVSVIWRQTHVMERVIFDILLMSKFIRLRNICANVTLMTFVSYRFIVGTTLEMCGSGV